MVGKKYFRLRHVIVANLILLMLACSDKGDSSTNNYANSNFLYSCLESNLSVSIVSDSANRFQIALPKSWDIENHSDSNFYGFFAMDTAIYIREEKIRTITVNLLTNKSGSIEEYFKAELNGMKNDSIPILSTGKFHKAYWVIVENQTIQSNNVDLMMYFHGSLSNEILIIQISVENSSNYEDIFCEFKGIVQSIQFFKNSRFTWLELL